MLETLAAREERMAWLGNMTAMMGISVVDDKEDEEEEKDCVVDGPVMLGIIVTVASSCPLVGSSDQVIRGSVVGLGFVVGSFLLALVGAAGSGSGLAVKLVVVGPRGIETVVWVSTC
ncbi:hypothetical protein BJY04DRAFT_178390 [Aspergillus karnatakaensis]|uniref:uncharacterized protein n=1 Tax=Aspergillus karnatakaensis TaxID=1810916 RepID=UPI003CCD9C6D